MGKWENITTEAGGPKSVFLMDTPARYHRLLGFIKRHLMPVSFFQHLHMFSKNNAGFVCWACGFFVLTHIFIYALKSGQLAKYYCSKPTKYRPSCLYEA